MCYNQQTPIDTKEQPLNACQNFENSPNLPLFKQDNSVENKDFINEVQIIEEGNINNFQTNGEGIEVSLSTLSECDKLLNTFNELASLLNQPIEVVKDECCLFEIRRLMSKLKKVIVGYNLKESELISTLSDCVNLGVGEILASPAYLPILIRQLKRFKEGNTKLECIIDFPFGESVFRAKLHDLKNAVKLGVKGVMVMMPRLLLAPNNLSSFKKQAKTLGKFRKVSVGLVFNGDELNAENLKKIFKVVEKTKLKYIAFHFDTDDLAFIEKRLELINLYRQKKPIKILANANDIDGVFKLNTISVDQVITPYADLIGQKLIKRFSVNLEVLS